MADLTLLVNSTDTALLSSGGAVSTVAPNGAAGSAASPAGFASVLGAQLTPADTASVSESPPHVSLVSEAAPVESGDTQPLSGKPLPSAALPEPLQPSDDAPGVLNTALLQPLLQGLPGASVQTAAPVAGLQATSLDTTLPSSGRAAILQMLGASLSQKPGEIAGKGASNAAALMTPAANTSAANMAQQAQAQTSVQPLMTASDNAQQAGTASAIPAMLGKPISLAAQQALARAGLNTGKPAGLRGESVSSAGLQLQTGQSNLSGAATGLNPSTGVLSRMDMFNAAMVTATKGDSSADLSLMARAGSAVSASPTAAMSALAEDTSGFSATLSRLPGVASNSVMPNMPLATPVGHSGWANELGQRVTWLANNELREAQLQLHPRSLGAVEVRIAFGHEQQLNISFSAANPVAREALDASLPRLREMLEQQGLQLADASISHESSAQREQRKPVNDASVLEDELDHADSPNGEALVENIIAAQSLGEGMLDAYA